MKQRDKGILDDLHRFRCMTRDDIVEIHFSQLKNPIGACNNVMKRLRRDGYVEVNSSQQPYIYFPSPAPIKKDSAKIKHFLAILDFYKQLRKHDIPKQFIVEPKYGKEYMEPDAFMIWKGAPFFLEVQCSIYSERVMQEKIGRYERYASSDKWKFEQWQPKGKKVFPYIWLVSDHKYNIDSKLMVFQSRSVEEFLQRLA